MKLTAPIGRTGIACAARPAELLDPTPACRSISIRPMPDLLRGGFSQGGCCPSAVKATALSARMLRPTAHEPAKSPVRRLSHF